MLVEQGERFGRFAAQNFFGKTGDRLFTREPENLQDILFADRIAAKGNQLIEHRFGIAQPAIGPARNRVGRRRLKSEFLLLRDRLQMLRDQFRRNAVQIETLTPTQDGWQNFLWLGSGEDEFHMRGRLLERLE